MEIKINLIPPYRKEEIARVKRFKLVIRLGLATFSVFVLFFFFLFGLYKVLEVNLAAVSTYQKPGLENSKYEKIKEFDEQFSKINSQTDQVMIISRDQIYWSNLFVLLSRAMISGIELTDLATNNYNISLAGQADDRDSLIAFRDKLIKENCFNNVNLPLSNLVSKENIAFQIDFSIKKECLKRK